MNMEFSFDEAEDVDELFAESRVVKIIDEMEFVEDELDYFDETEIQRELTEMF
ncbi:hypothetical protein [Nitrosomonas aestuarii]|uniref:Uncharacterized protein n=1 Tax=Nitrosomonas aestuarii TaxID=52441 RepID=A0A1I4D5J5_9PROT|nr:hypothetical protein [Nitrosomonas aestuarii]PTN09147.1 hypothetical protein C8R11_12425 [Nitrosomonas aestuarii]SFK88405.1 hypothetical protein SAMN05216302_101914 [Nitrosomonas aestuarii]